MKRSVLIYSLIAGILLIACSPGKKSTSLISQPAKEDSLPPLPVSEIDIPIKIAAKPLFARTETLVPKEFLSDKWPDYTQSSCDFRYKYRFVRSALQFACVNNQVSISFGGNYQIAGSRTVCAFNQPVSPWISGSCGFGSEPMRRVNLSMNSFISFLPDYKIRTNTQLTQLQPLDKCQVTLFNNDMTNEVLDSIRASVSAFTHTFDSTVAALDFSNFLKIVSEKSSRKIAMSKYGYLQVRPTIVRTSPISLVKDSLVMSAGVSGYAELTSDSTDLATINSFPVLRTAAQREGISIYANTHYDYSFLSKLITDTISNKGFDIEGRTFVVKKVEIGRRDHQLEIKIDFAGNKKGRFILYGTPVLDLAKQTISIPDVNFDLQSGDVLLNVGEKLFRNRIINSLKQKAFIDIASMVLQNKGQLDAQLSRPINKSFSTKGKINDVKITGLVIGAAALHLQTWITANIAVIGNGL